MTTYRYWHKRFEHCRPCNRYMPVNGNLSCPHGHRIEGIAPQFRAVNGCLLKGALVVYKNPVSYAQAANFLSEWNTEESWRDIAKRLTGSPLRREIERAAALLNAHACRRTDSDKLMALLGVHPRRTSTVAFHFHDRDLANRFRALVDGHEGGRYEWAREQVKENSNENA